MTEVKVQKKKKQPIISGLIWIFIGLLLLGQTTNLIPPMEQTWPIIIIVIGIAFIIGSVLKRNK